MHLAYRDILKHSAVYGLGQVLARLASFLLLPLYTSYLSPEEYGCIAILDLTVAVLGILIGSGAVAAISRHHFEAQNEKERNQVWWTGASFLAVAATTVVAPAWLSRDILARVTLGLENGEGGYFYAIALPTLWFTAVGWVADAYLRVRKWSVLSVCLSLCRLFINVALNVFFLVNLGMGVAGVLWGNLITGGLMMLISFTIFVYDRGTYAFHLPLVSKLWRFSVPLIGVAFLQLVMRQADRYFLRVFLDLHEVGVYSLASNIGQAVNTLCLLPFASIWGVVVYEIAEQSDAKRTYARVYAHFTYGIMVAMLGACLFARPLIELMAAPDYLPAADLIPLICLGQLFFSLNTFFNIPALVAKKTSSLLPGNLLGAVVSLLGNVLLIPLLSGGGAAWASVLAFGVLSATTLLMCRRIDRIDYSLVRSGLVLTGMGLCYVGYRSLGYFELSDASLCAVGGLTWAGWAMPLVGRVARWAWTASQESVSTA